jgi:hypothetical protein
VELQSDFEKICEQYLLGELTESERQQIEEAYFADDSLFERFLAVKDDLLDAYVRGGLSGAKLKSFEQHFLSSQPRRQRVEETRDLIQVTSAVSIDTPAFAASPKLSNDNRLSWWQLIATRHPVMWRTGLVAALLLLMAGGYAVVRQLRVRSEEERARNATKPPDEKIGNENATQKQAPTPDVNTGGERAISSPSPLQGVSPEIMTKTPPRSAAQIASLTLLPINTRETGSANSLTIGPEQRLVRLNLVFGGGVYDSFEVSVRTVDGQDVIRRRGLKAISNAGGKTVVLTFDSSLLSRQDYIATLRGWIKSGKLETINEYYFRVQHTGSQLPATPGE